jgi:hypothetical protein
MIVAQEFSKDLQRPLEESLRTGKVSLRFQHKSEIVEPNRHVRMIGAERGFIKSQACRMIV